ncbi:rhodanese-like domain-containing protein 6 [Typha latifolia]|uniref:rhodanese-like domain-containing protein 6 n=1 Tax=Typha latifolia TaxID=4733 RepID=UPI003C2BD624
MEENVALASRNGDGVLLYYKYAPVPDVPSLVRFYNSNSRSLGLLGRVRIAPDGVNVTVGGKMSSLEKHIAELESMSLFEGTDFKLASCERPSNEKIAQECGFTSLSIRVVKELVTFRSNPLSKSPEILDAGKHLSAVEFHQVLHDAGNNLASQESIQQKQLVLLDARNVYETRVGKFQTPNIETLDPEIRQYSDLPSWIDQQSEQLRGKSILMYCTGGIRCEMASAYIRSKGVDFDNVFQLYGGIQRYLEQFPDGGYFKGKNFVFDHRISVGSLDARVLGTCLICASSFDDYSSRCRCSHCRMLVLVCSDCQVNSKVYVCELCQKNDKAVRPMPSRKDSQLQLELSPDSEEAIEIAKVSFQMTPSELSSHHDGDRLRKLKILCLHGFRQNGSNFKGRTSSLAKKLKNIVEFTFIDAPHELPYIYQPDLDKKHHCSSMHSSSPDGSFKRKFAWLISPELSPSVEQDWKIADVPFDPLQYQQQTAGFEKSYAYLETTISRMCHFDGILGFSQGAAMAALFCKQQQKISGAADFRFGIFCSGYSAISGDVDAEPIKIPSLHCFGSGQGQDRQIARAASIDLANLFDKDSSVIIEHDMGHIIPTRPPYIDQIKGFLSQFL